MYRYLFSLRFSRIVFLAFAVLPLAGSSFAIGAKETVVYNFLGSSDGYGPKGTLVADAAGNLYGTTYIGGACSAAPACQGTVFELSPPAAPGDAWTHTVLYSFQSNGSDANNPGGTLIFDKQGNLYGTAGSGGLYEKGAIFELSPPAAAGGTWTETVIWSFPKGAKRGVGPDDHVAMDEDGNLYGTTFFGGLRICDPQSGPDCGGGVVFEIVKPTIANAPWKERVLHEFGAGGDGYWPLGSVILRGGVLYGTTELGGANNGGIVYQLERQAGLWTETILYSFANGTWAPAGLLTHDSDGNLYGMTVAGGNTKCPFYCGVVYELSPPVVAGGQWSETTLYSFNGDGDGAGPSSNSIAFWRDKQGDLFGTSAGGRKHNGFPYSTGAVFKLKAPATSGGPWMFDVVHDFVGPDSGDGLLPAGGLILVNGLFYGITQSGGTTGNGTVYSIVP